LNRTSIGSLGLRAPANKPELLKGEAASALDDQTETKRTLETLGEMPDVDMSMIENQASVGENLEVDDDDEEANRLDIDKRTSAMEVEEDVDPLDAFMSGVKEEVQKVNAEDRVKVNGNSITKSGMAQRMDGDDDDEDETAPVENDFEGTDLNPEDILALAAKKAKKKDVAIIDHTKVTYEPFRKEFYHPPSEIQEMTEEEADLLRLELDGIKIRGLDCPKPITKWSHCGLPSSW
jgi:ATP-dependent RNA helicase DDX46/PRP5